MRQYGKQARYCSDGFLSRQATRSKKRHGKLGSKKGLSRADLHYELYLKYSRLVRRIYARYSDTIEPFGMDENWISIPYCKGAAETGLQVAEEIRRAVREKIGLTVSIGVSFSKIYAKLGSDMKKPDAVTVIGEDNYREKVWPLPVSDLLQGCSIGAFQFLYGAIVRREGCFRDRRRSGRCPGTRSIRCWLISQLWRRRRCGCSSARSAVQSHR